MHALLWHAGWFAKPDYTPVTLYEEIVRRCETNTCGECGTVCHVPVAPRLHAAARHQHHTQTPRLPGHRHAPPTHPPTPTPVPLFPTSFQPPNPPLLPPAGVDALYMICKLAATPQDARVALNAFAAVRASLVRQGRVAPYDTRLAVAFVHVSEGREDGGERDWERGQRGWER